MQDWLGEFMIGTVSCKRFTVILPSLQIFRRETSDTAITNNLRETGDDCEKAMEHEWRE
jgi:hypothetical protein